MNTTIQQADRDKFNFEDRICLALTHIEYIDGGHDLQWLIDSGLADSPKEAMQVQQIQVTALLDLMRVMTLKELNALDIFNMYV